MKEYNLQIGALAAVFLLTLAFGNEKNQNLVVTEWIIEGMTCVSCARNLEGGLSSVKGVVACKVDYASKSMVCRLDESVPGVSEIPDLVKNMGYRIILKSSKLSSEGNTSSSNRLATQKSTCCFTNGGCWNRVGI